jgi:hypothetical protein
MKILLKIFTTLGAIFLFIAIATTFTTFVEYFNAEPEQIKTAEFVCLSSWILGSVFTIIAINIAHKINKL